MGTHGRKQIVWRIVRNFQNGGHNVYGEIGERHYPEYSKEKCKKLYMQEWRELNDFIQFAFR